MGMYYFPGAPGQMFLIYDKFENGQNSLPNLITRVPDLVSVWDEGIHRILGRGEDSPKRVEFAEEEEEKAHGGVPRSQEVPKGITWFTFLVFSDLVPVFQSGFFRTLVWPNNRAPAPPKAVSVRLFLSFPPVSTRPLRDFFAQGQSYESLAFLEIFQFIEMTLGDDYDLAPIKGKNIDFQTMTVD